MCVRAGVRDARKSVPGNDERAHFQVLKRRPAVRIPGPAVGRCRCWNGHNSVRCLRGVNVFTIIANDRPASFTVSISRRLQSRSWPVSSGLGHLWIRAASPPMRPATCGRAVSCSPAPALNRVPPPLYGTPHTRHILWTAPVTAAQNARPVSSPYFSSSIYNITGL